MKKRPRKHYTDVFRAEAIALLEANGYPDQKGALLRTAKSLDMPNNTLRNWFLRVHNPVDAKLSIEKKVDLAQVIKDELEGIFKQMKVKRDEASYKDLAWTAGVLFDKIQILSGQPTEQSKNEVIIRYATDYTRTYTPASRASESNRISA